MTKFIKSLPYLLFIGLIGGVLLIIFYPALKPKDETKIPYVYVTSVGVFALMFLVGLFGSIFTTSKE